MLEARGAHTSGRREAAESGVENNSLLQCRPLEPNCTRPAEPAVVAHAGRHSGGGGSQNVT